MVDFNHDVLLVNKALKYNRWSGNIYPHENESTEIHKIKLKKVEPRGLHFCVVLLHFFLILESFCL